MKSIEELHAENLGKGMAEDMDKWLINLIHKLGYIPPIITSGKHEIQCEVIK